MIRKRSKVSVVIPTYNSWTTLKDCISSILKQTLKPSEIIIIDNGSTDNTYQKVKDIFPHIKIIKLKKNTGVTGGRNKGIENCSSLSNYILFFDHDMVAHKDMIKNLVSTGDKEKSIGIVTPKIYYWKDKKRIWAAGTGINLYTGQILFRGGYDIKQFDREEEVQVAPAAILVNMNVIKKIKKFDNTYFATYEDTDFCFRAKKAGFKTYYAPLAVAYHKLPLQALEERKRLLSRSYWIGRNRVIFMKNHGNSFLIFLLFLPIFSLYYLYISIQAKKITSWFNFLYGTMKGLIYTV